MLRWNREVARLLLADEMKKRLLSEGMEVAGGPPEEFGTRVKEDIENWRHVMKEAHIQQEG